MKSGRTTTVAALTEFSGGDGDFLVVPLDLFHDSGDSRDCHLVATKRIEIENESRKANNCQTQNVYINVIIIAPSGRRVSRG